MSMSRLLRPPSSLSSTKSPQDLVSAIGSKAASIFHRPPTSPIPNILRWKMTLGDQEYCCKNFYRYLSNILLVGFASQISKGSFKFKVDTEHSVWKLGVFLQRDNWAQMWLFQWFSNSVYCIVLLLLSAWSRDARGNAKQFLLYKKTEKERRLALHENGTHFAQKSNTPADTTIPSPAPLRPFFFNVGGTEQHRVVSNILGSFTTKLQECRKTSAHIERRSLFATTLTFRWKWW